MRCSNVSPASSSAPNGASEAAHYVFLPGTVTGVRLKRRTTCFLPGTVTPGAARRWYTVPNDLEKTVNDVLITSR